MLFTDRYIKGLVPQRNPFRTRENGSDKGFGIQVTPGGVKTFFIAYESLETGTRRFMNLGHYVSGRKALANARERCREARELIDQNIDPQNEAERIKAAHEKAELEEKRKGSVKQLFDGYVDSLESKGKSSFAEVRRVYNHDIKPVLDENMKAKEVTPHHVKLVLAKVVKRKKLVLANRLRSYMHAAFKFGIKFDHNPSSVGAEVLFDLVSNPVFPVPKQEDSEKVGERNLSTKEIGRLWRALDSSSLLPQYQFAIKLLLATGGQRVKEVLEAETREIDIERGVWEIPSTRTKNGKAHIVPLPNLAISILEEIDPQGKLLLPRGEDPKRPLTLGQFAHAVSTFCKREKFERFTPRDIRRTCKSRMAEIGLSKEIRDRLNNHALNDVSTKHYDRYEYFKEKQIAMEAWNEYLMRVIEGDNDNVVEIKGA